MSIVMFIDQCGPSWEIPFQERIDSWSDSYQGDVPEGLFGFFCIYGCKE